MAKIVKKSRRKIRLEGVAVIMITTSIISLLFTSLFINTVNTSLTIQIQKTSAQIEQLKSDNYSLNVQIQELQNKERVYVIAEDAGLNQNQENIISVNTMGE